jgi:hypothetical protein
MARSGQLSSGTGHQAPALDATWAAQGNAAKLLIARSLLAGLGPRSHPCPGPTAADPAGQRPGKPVTSQVTTTPGVASQSATRHHEAQYRPPGSRITVADDGTGGSALGTALQQP